MDLTDRVALITGARRIGASVAGELARRGAQISLSCRKSPDDVQEATAAVRDAGGTAITPQVDLAQAKDCGRLIDETVSSLGRLDVVVNMASSYVYRSFNELDESDWDRALAIDAKAAYLCTLAAVPYLRAAGEGRIINFSDWTAGSGRPRYSGYLPYYVAKSAVIALTEALALELAGDHILVNAIALGPIRPPADTEPRRVLSVAHVTPVGRWGGDQAVVDAVVAIVESDFMTGETLRVDGGRHLR